jgi:hypothetical protein
VRIATRLGIKRRAPQNETPHLSDYLAAGKAGEPGDTEGSP